MEWRQASAPLPCPSHVTLVDTALRTSLLSPRWSDDQAHPGPRPVTMTQSLQMTRQGWALAAQAPFVLRQCLLG